MKIFEADDPDLLANAVVLSGENGRLVFEVRDYERPGGAPDYHDANWLTTSVTISAGVFLGSFQIALEACELQRLCSDLKKCVDAVAGTVVFENTETDLRLKIEFRERGKAAISGEAKPTVSRQGRLAFLFESDQSYLAETVKQLAVMIRRFPVRES